MRKILCALLFALPFLGSSQHTFSIVAIDSITGEIGSAGVSGEYFITPYVQELAIDVKKLTIESNK